MSGHRCRNTGRALGHDSGAHDRADELRAGPTMWIVMRMQDFEFEPSRVMGLAVKIDSGKMIGYLPVYATREDAEAEYPDGPFAQVREFDPKERAS